MTCPDSRGPLLSAPVTELPLKVGPLLAGCSTLSFGVPLAQFLPPLHLQAMLLINSQFSTLPLRPFFSFCFQFSDNGCIRYASLGCYNCEPNFLYCNVSAKQLPSNHPPGALSATNYQ